MGLKLLYITNGINGAGGLERVLSIKASYFVEQLGYEVHVLVLNDAHLEPFYQFSNQIIFHSIEVIGNSLQYFFSYKKGIQQAVDEVKADVILVCDDGLKGFFLPTIIKASAKWIYERHVSKLIEVSAKQDFIQRNITKIKWKLMDKLASRFSKFVVLTEGNKKEWQTLNNIIVIANPLSFFPDRSANLDNKVVLCVGKISYQKGQDILVRAWEKVHEKYPNWQLHLYGSENLEILDTRALSNNVHFFLPEKDIKGKYLESSVYVMSSRYEGFGMVLIEAMACGLPVVSFNCPSGPRDIISHQEDGFLIENQNSEAFSQAIIELIQNIELRKKMGANARIKSQNYKIESIMKLWESLFGEL